MSVQIQFYHQDQGQWVHQWNSTEAGISYGENTEAEDTSFKYGGIGFC